MGKRSDGIRTRDRILEAASEVFAQKGYHDATVEDICGHADANIAAINYHFGSKDQLYAEVWREAFKAAMKTYPPEGGLAPDAPVEERLRGSIHSMICRSVDPGRIGHAGKLLLREITHPTDVIRDIKREAIQPLHERMCRMMRQLLGPEAGQDLVLLCAMSVVHQCLMVGIRLFTGSMPAAAVLDLPADELAATLTEHITRFSLAGVKAMSKDLEARHTR